VRAFFGEALVRLGNEVHEVVVLTGDVAKSTGVGGFAKEHPGRFHNIGISEQDIIGIASGLSLSGKIPVVVLFAPFMLRAWEQIRSTIARGNLNVKLVGTHAGLSAADEGASHQALEDVAIMRALPNMTVIVPGDRREIAEATGEIVRMKGPVYMRLGRDEDLSFLEGDDVFRVGKAVTVAEGHDVTVFSNGAVTPEVLKAAKMAKVSARVVHVPTVKPLDKEAIVSAAKATGRVVCAEEHSVIGALGGAVSELLSSEFPVPVRRIGVQDVFGESGPNVELLKKHGLLAECISGVLAEVAGGKTAC